jgi:phage terminase large subunit-like protein
MFLRAAECRRWGKTLLGINRVADPEVLRYPVGWFAPSYKLMLEVWREVGHTLKPIIVRQNASERRIELITGGVLEFWSLDNPDAGRGRRYKRIIVDEAALVKNLMDIWQLSLRSTLVDFGGDAFFLSTPKGRNGFWQMWQWGQDEARDEWASWQMPTSGNPKIAAKEVEVMRATMPERVYAQEILATFIEDAGSVFRRVVDAATAIEQEPQGNRQYIIGCDWAKSQDFSVFTVLDVAAKRMVYMDRFNQIDYVVQVGRLKALCDKYKPTAIIAETNSIGTPVIEQLQRQGLPVQPFTTTNATKAQAIDALALAFEQGNVEILNDATLIAELQSYEMERLPSGMMRYNAPSGMHDDCVMSLALAWHGIGKPSASELVSFI